MFWAGYRQDPNRQVGGSDTADTAWGLSAGVAHGPSGINVSGNYSTQQTKGNDARPAPGSPRWAGKAS